MGEELCQKRSALRAKNGIDIVLPTTGVQRVGEAVTIVIAAIEAGGTNALPLAILIPKIARRISPIPLSIVAILAGLDEPVAAQCALHVIDALAGTHPSHQHALLCGALRMIVTTIGIAGTLILGWFVDHDAALEEWVALAMRIVATIGIGRARVDTDRRRIEYAAPQVTGVASGLGTIGIAKTRIRASSRHDDAALALNIAFGVWNTLRVHQAIVTCTRLIWFTHIVSIALSAPRLNDAVATLARFVRITDVIVVA